MTMPAAEFASVILGCTGDAVKAKQALSLLKVKLGDEAFSAHVAASKRNPNACSQRQIGQTVSEVRQARATGQSQSIVTALKQLQTDKNNACDYAYKLAQDIMAMNKLTGELMEVVLELALNSQHDADSNGDKIVVYRTSVEAGAENEEERASLRAHIDGLQTNLAEGTEAAAAVQLDMQTQLNEMNTRNAAMQEQLTSLQGQLESSNLKFATVRTALADVTAVINTGGV